MRFTPASIALACALALTASAGISQKTQNPAYADPRTAGWTAKGAAALEANDLAAARDAYETALMLSPRDIGIHLALARIARAEKLPGRAIKYYADALAIDPNNQLALQGQGLAMVDKGARETARGVLAKLQATCKGNCPLTQPLIAAIGVGAPRIVASEDVTPKPEGQVLEK